MRIVVVEWLLLLSVGALGCNAAGPDGAGKIPERPLASVPAAQDSPASAALPAGWRHSVDRTTGVRLPMPAEGYALRGEHYRSDLPPQKMRHRLDLRGPAGPALEVQVWDNAEGLDLDAWFERTLGSLRDADPVLGRGVASVAEVAAIFLEFPRSPQSARQRMAIFALGNRVYRIVCFDADDDGAAMLFDRAVAGFAVEGTP